MYGICTALDITAKINTTLPARTNTPSVSAAVAQFTVAVPYTGVE